MGQWQQSRLHDPAQPFLSQRFLQPDVNRISSNLVISEKAGSSSQLFKANVCMTNYACLPRSKITFWKTWGKSFSVSSNMQFCYYTWSTLLSVKGQFNLKHLILGSFSGFQVSLSEVAVCSITNIWKSHQQYTYHSSGRGPPQECLHISMWQYFAHQKIQSVSYYINVYDFEYIFS